MPRLYRISRTARLAVIALLATACSTTATYNPTVFPFEIDEAGVQKDKIRTVVIAHVNLGTPSRSYLEREAPRIDGYVSTYLKEHGYKVLPQRQFTQEWNTAVRAFGNPVDPTTGNVNMKTFVLIMNSVRDRLRETTELDAFIFTDLVEFKASFNIGLNHLARWDGVTRKPALQGPGSGVPVDFDWNQLVEVASLQVSIYDMELQRIFVSRGGLEATEAIDTRSSEGRFTRRRNVLENKTEVMEGIQLAFHPFIEYKDWPGNP